LGVDGVFGVLIVDDVAAIEAKLETFVAYLELFTK
jgi:hypothetical protein